MKKILSTIALLFIGFISFGQITSTNGVKKIEVTGQAEMEIIPDEIYLRITLKEYKNGTKTVSINTLEAELVKAVKKMNLEEDALRVENIYGYNWDWKKKKTGDFLASKSFKLKLNDVKKVNDLVNSLDNEGLNNLNISELNHSKIEEHKMNLKIEALKNAKVKAGKLLTAIDEELGSALEIQEIEYINAPSYARNQMMMSTKMDGNYESNLEFKNITIKAEVKAVFEIK